MSSEHGTIAGYGFALSTRRQDWEGFAERHVPELDHDAVTDILNGFAEDCEELRHAFPDLVFADPGDQICGDTVPAAFARTTFVNTCRLTAGPIVQVQPSAQALAQLDLVKRAGLAVEDPGWRSYENIE